MRSLGFALLMIGTVALTASCQSGPQGGMEPTPSPPGAAAPQTPAASPSPTAPCPPLGSTNARQSPSDPTTLSTLTGAAIRLGKHQCYERFVFEMQGAGAAPGWRVGYVDPPLTADPSGEPVQLLGDAAMEVVVGVWTVDDFQGRPAEWQPFTGQREIRTGSGWRVREVRILSSFEGMTQIGLGVDRQRPFEVSTLPDPPRLVVDIATSPASP